MKTITLYELEERLFKEWEELSKKNGDWEIDKDGNGNLVHDGLLCKGKTYYDELSGYSWRERGDEETMWLKSPLRIMFITKDDYRINCDDREDSGIRRWSNGQGDLYKFFKNIALWLYLLSNIDDTGKVPTFEEVFNTKKYIPFFHKTSFARINCKKQLGGKSISPTTLKNYMERYKELLIQNIMMYDADIIVCCDGPGVIKDFVKDNCFHDMKKINGGIYYSASTNKIIVHAYHPSYFIIGYEDMYNEMKGYFEDFLSKHPSFMRPNR
jgi:hypothetical protein